ncbi:hypothetical protein SASPL_102785 [Salvia splendens]|uniref:Uncharacterized protein n=1 Tax=Salvia splendens TaxID=180675 RepID=A0A8X8YXB6_SALSN|nr:hypothetical protein SASPL_102785 [Salvia splendens]
MLNRDARSKHTPNRRFQSEPKITLNIEEIRASVLTIQVGFDTDRRGLADDGFRFSGAGAPLPAVVASDLTADNDEDAAVITTAIVRYSLSLLGRMFKLMISCHGFVMVELLGVSADPEFVICNLLG